MTTPGQNFLHQYQPNSQFITPTASGSPYPGRYPHQLHNQQQQQQQQLQGHAAAAQFTPEMRDRQARGKDPYRESDESSSEDGAGAGPAAWGRYRHAGEGRTSLGESFSIIQGKRLAAQVLDSPELLMMNALRAGETLPAARLRYTRMLCGVKAPSSPARAQRSFAPPGYGQGSRATVVSGPSSRSSRNLSRNQSSHDPSSDDDEGEYDDDDDDLGFD